MQEISFKNNDDLCDLSELDQDIILYNLHQRYKQDKIFTRIGPTTIIALNPYKQIPHLFEDAVLEKIAETIFRGDPCREPHVYITSGKAFQGILNNEPKQTIVISGESGAGKTESAKYCLKMLTRLSRSQGQQEQHHLSRKILASNPILQAFGNSKTIRNENSSRFGKYLQIYFDESRSIKGASIRSYLLQKTRVVSIAPGERSFHIFYSFCAAHSQDPRRYSLLNGSGSVSREGRSDIQLYNEVCEGMKEMGFEISLQQRIWELLEAILLLCNLQFDDSQHKQDTRVCCSIVNMQTLRCSSKLLGISQIQLEEAILVSKLRIGRQVTNKPFDKNECIESRNTLCKAIYSLIFNSIIHQINQSLNPEQKLQLNRSMSRMHEQTPTFEVNILDIFGFQNFKNNSFEQLCINYANQKLLQVYNKCVFEQQLQNLKEDGIEVESLVAPTNERRIMLLEAIFRIVKDKTLIKQFKDQDIIGAFKANRENNADIRTIEYNIKNDKEFIIKHSPCDVGYSVIGFKVKNHDKIRPELQSIIAGLLNVKSGSTHSKTLLQKFALDIRTLTDELQQSENHYVRCIKPNDFKSNYVEPEFMRRQIRYMGVCETIKIRKIIFPYRRTYQEFADHYRDLFVEAKGKNEREVAEIVFKEMKAGVQSYFLGNKRVYIDLEVQEQLNSKVLENEKRKLENVKRIIQYYRRRKWLKVLRKSFDMVVRRIKLLRKWGNHIENQRRQMIFGGFMYIKMRFEGILRHQIQQEKRRLSKELQRRNQSIENTMQERVNIEEQSIVINYNPMTTICRFKSEREESQISRQADDIEKKFLRQELEFSKNQNVNQFEEIEKLRSQIQRLKVQVSQERQKVSNAGQELSKKQKELSVLRLENGQKQKKLNQMQKQKTNILFNLTQIKNNSIIFDKEKNNLLIRLQVKENECQILNKQLHQLVQTSSDMKKQDIENLLSQITILQKNNLEREAKIANLQQNLHKTEKTLHDCKDIHETEIQKLKEQKLSIQTQFQEKIQVLKSEVFILVQKNKELSDQNRKQLILKRELIQNYDNLDKNFKQMKDKYDEHMSKCSMLGSRIKARDTQLIDRLNIKIAFQEREIQKREKTIKDLQFSKNQLNKVNQNLRIKIMEQQKDRQINENQKTVESPLLLSEKQILQQLKELRKTMNANQLNNLRAKIGYLVS